MSDIMKKLNMGNMFPYDVPEGYAYRHLTNFCSKQIDLYRDAVSTFDFKDNISMRIIDNAITNRGEAIDDYYALYVIYPIKVYKPSAEEIELWRVLEQLGIGAITNNVPSSRLKEFSESSLLQRPCPDMGPFWRYFEMIQDTKYPHLKFRI